MHMMMVSQALAIFDTHTAKHLPALTVASCACACGKMARQNCSLTGWSYVMLRLSLVLQVGPSNNSRLSQGM